MKILKPAEIKSIEQFFQLKQESLLKVMSKYLKTKYKEVYFTPDYIVAVGDIPIAVVAHLDTVFTSPPENIFYDRVKNVMWSPEGMGADDRAGVYAIIQLIKQGLRPTVIFTTDEERGALGAEKLIKDYPEAITELKYIIQLDRRGSNDCVFYDCENPAFEEYIETFDFVTTFGTFSDISVICPAWGVAGVNLSIGYVDEHTYSELLYVGNMLSTISKVERMLRSADKAEKFEYIPASYTKYYNKYAYAYGYDFDAYDDDYGWDPSYGVSKSTWKSWHTPKDLMTCHGCGIKDYDYNLFPTKTANGGTIFLCSDCIGKTENLAWCKTCGEPFIIKEEDIDHKLCYDCAERERFNDTNTGN